MVVGEASESPFQTVPEDTTKVLSSSTDNDKNIIWAKEVVGRLGMFQDLMYKMATEVGSEGQSEDEEDEPDVAFEDESEESEDGSEGVSEGGMEELEVEGEEESDGESVESEDESDLHGKMFIMQTLACLERAMDGSPFVDPGSRSHLNPKTNAEQSSEPQEVFDDALSMMPTAPASLSEPPIGAKRTRTGETVEQLA